MADQQTRIVVRVLQVFADRVDRCAELAGAKDRSEFVREALEAAVAREEAEQRRRRTGRTRLGASRPLGATRSTVPGLCLHPVTARELRGTQKWCRACGSRLG